MSDEDQTRQPDDEDFALDIRLHREGIGMQDLGALTLSLAQAGRGILILPGTRDDVRNLRMVLIGADQEEAESLLTLILHTLEHGEDASTPTRFDHLEDGTWLRSSENRFYRRADAHGGWFDGQEGGYITDLPLGETYRVLKQGEGVAPLDAKGMPLGSVLLDFEGDPLIHVDERGWAYPWDTGHPEDLLQFSDQSEDYYLALEG